MNAAPNKSSFRLSGPGAVIRGLNLSYLSLLGSYNTDIYNIDIYTFIFLVSWKDN